MHSVHVGNLSRTHRRRACSVTPRRRGTQAALDRYQSYIADRVGTGAVVAFVGCSDITGIGNGTVGGSYILASVNSNSLPFTYTSGSNTITINSDLYNLQSNGTYNETINETISNGYSSSPASDAESGTWARTVTLSFLSELQHSGQHRTVHRLTHRRRHIQSQFADVFV